MVAAVNLAGAKVC